MQTVRARRGADPSSRWKKILRVALDPRLCLPLDGEPLAFLGPKYDFDLARGTHSGHRPETHYDSTGRVDYTTQKILGTLDAAGGLATIDDNRQVTFSTYDGEGAVENDASAATIPADEEERLEQSDRVGQPGGSDRVWLQLPGPHGLDSIDLDADGLVDRREEYEYDDPGIRVARSGNRRQQRRRYGRHHHPRRLPPRQEQPHGLCPDSGRNGGRRRPGIPDNPRPRRLPPGGCRQSAPAIDFRWPTFTSPYVFDHVRRATCGCFMESRFDRRRLRGSGSRLEFH